MDNEEKEEGRIEKTYLLGCIRVQLFAKKKAKEMRKMGR